MQIKDWASCPNQAKLYRELAELDLLENIAELDVFGFTVVPPGKVAPPEFHARVKEALIDVIEGLRPDYDYHAFDLAAYRQKQERMLALARETVKETKDGGDE